MNQLRGHSGEREAARLERGLLVCEGERALRRGHFDEVLRLFEQARKLELALGDPPPRAKE